MPLLQLYMKPAFDETLVHLAAMACSYTVDIFIRVRIAIYLNPRLQPIPWPELSISYLRAKHADELAPRKKNSSDRARSLEAKLW